MANGVKISDRGSTVYKDLVKRLQEAKGLEAVVGILQKDGAKKKKSSDGSSTSATILDVGFIHEYGAPKSNIPERSFLRQGVKLGQEEINRTLEDTFLEVIDGKMDAKEALGVAAEVARGYVLEQFQVEGSPAWDPLKHRDGRALQDTGQLMQSIHTQVRDKGKK